MPDQTDCPMSDNSYHFDKKTKVGSFTIEVDTAAAYGYFEHEVLGEDRGGGLWFERKEDGSLELSDFDGVDVLPKKVAEGLRGLGFIVSEEFN